MKTATLFVTTFLSAGLLLSFAPTPSVAADNRDVVHDVRGNVVTNTFGLCVRTKWVSDHDECAPPPQEVAQVEKPTPTPPAEMQHRQIADDARTAYFEFDKAVLMESERQKLDALVNTLKSMDDLSGVSVVGYADRMGSDSYNERLSKKRAQAVEAYLRERGYLHTTIASTRWLGESVPTTHCAEGMKRSSLISCLQSDRRVTVEMQYEEDKPKENSTY